MLVAHFSHCDRIWDIFMVPIAHTQDGTFAPRVPAPPARPSTGFFLNTYCVHAMSPMHPVSSNCGLDLCTHLHSLGFVGGCASCLCVGGRYRTRWGAAALSGARELQKTT